eukprot:271573_1
MASIPHNMLMKNYRNSGRFVSKSMLKCNTTSLSIIKSQRRNNSDFGFSFEDNDDNFVNFGGNFGGNQQSQRGGYSNINPSRQRGGGDFDMFGQRGGGFREKKQFSRAHIEWSKESLTPFTKDFYSEHPEITKMSDSEVAQFRKTNSMIIHGDNIPKPF